MNICIIDDQMLMAESVKRLLKGTGVTDQIKTYGSPLDFLGADLRGWVPDLIMTAQSMDDMDGLEMVDRAKGIWGAGIKFILLTSLNSVQTVQAAFSKGASAYLTRDASEKEVLEAVTAARQDERYMNGSMRDKLLSHISFREEPASPIAPKEKEVLKRICDGSTPKEIAYDMRLSINTVQSYIKNLLRKFKVNRTADMVSFVARNGTAV